jgi:hypothetical protein
MSSPWARVALNRRALSRSLINRLPDHVSLSAAEKSSSHRTLRWREMDSNPWSRFLYSPEKSQLWQVVTAEYRVVRHLGTL